MTDDEKRTFEMFCDNATRVEQELVNAMSTWEADKVGPDSILAALLCVAEQIILINDLPDDKAEEIRKSSRLTAKDRVAYAESQSETAESDRQDD